MEIPETEERWEVYPGALDEKFAMFAIDLGVAEEAPFENLPWLDIVRVRFEPLPNGMPTPETNKKLYAVEDAMAEQLADRGAIAVGRLTTAGRREIFVYSATNDAELIEKELTTQFEELDLQTQATHDPQWKAYFEFLYPNPLDFQRIHNQQVVRTLAAHGDEPQVPRTIDHYAYFPSQESRAAFRDELVEHGYEITEERAVEDGGDGNRYVLSFTSFGPVDLQSIDQVTIPLFVRADQLGGHYDGWGCPVASADDTAGEEE
jgi:uncharacterized protein (TIGR01619 family)